MPRKRKLLNIRDHLDHVQMIFEGLKHYGMCPALDEEIAKARVINRAIVGKHDERRSKGDRKDIRINQGGK